LLVFLDDDMRVTPTFVASHRAAHTEGRSGPGQHGTHVPPRVVLGALLPQPGIDEMVLYERFFAEMLLRMASAAAHGRAPRGADVYTGNLSLPRRLFFDVGGFNFALRQLEDAELGVRLEKAGAQICFSSEAAAVHVSAGGTMAAWRARSFRDGEFAERVARIHADFPPASPFRHLGNVHPLARPLLAAAAASPRAVEPLVHAATLAAEAVDRAGFKQLALRGTALVYGLEFFRGVAAAAGSPSATWKAYREYASRAAHSMSPRSGAVDVPNVRPNRHIAAAWVACRAAIAADHEELLRQRARYGHEQAPRHLVGDAAATIGFQVMVGYRVMRALHAAGATAAAMVVSRGMRHLYGSDIHYEADLAPGVVIVHGFGLAIAKGVRVSARCTLFQNVTLGVGLSPTSRMPGVPTLESDVHVGVGATVIGPLVIGARSKISPGCVVRDSVPPDSLVEAPSPVLRPRRSPA
jgi:serine acetyltransferase